MCTPLFNLNDWVFSCNAVVKAVPVVLVGVSENADQSAFLLTVGVSVYASVELGTRQGQTRVGSSVTPSLQQGWGVAPAAMAPCKFGKGHPGPGGLGTSGAAEPGAARQGVGPGFGGRLFLGQRAGKSGYLSSVACHFVGPRETHCVPIVTVASSLLITAANITRRTRDLMSVSHTQSLYPEKVRKSLSIGSQKLISTLTNQRERNQESGAARKRDFTFLFFFQLHIFALQSSIWKRQGQCGGEAIFRSSKCLFLWCRRTR